ncbi:MAG: NUDIX domain-containing protein [Intrasporangium sp.]|uniref:NUDIX hydrolase n=1 Tax=Intrasporangium sp. TaxID=1925024 RepID=UPI002648EAB5|nr:NUDIX domain-containing protein [Intrasporangium sp.]MDN5795538.1 NUDIX domain-containing protein [Intrasporangium sp.]
MRTNVPGGVRVVAAPDRGAPVSLGRIAHGQHPESLLHSAGWIVQTPLSAVVARDGAIELAYRVSPLSGIPPRLEEVRRDPDVSAHLTGEPHQRVAAYALVVTGKGVLLTKFTAQTHVSGQWGLPGGGLEPGETPAEGVLREVWEETGQRVRLGALVAIQSSHWIGRAPSRAVEDFHAIRLVYRADCPDPTDPVIHDVGGTTGDARWVPPDQLHDLALTPSWRAFEALVPTDDHSSDR